jgi:hypothetical protein
MKRFVLSLMLIMVSSGVYAGCITTEQCPVFTDIARLVAAERIAQLAGVGSLQSIKAMKQMIDDGVVIVIPKGTTVSAAEKINDHVSWVDIKGFRVIIGNGFYRCE